MYVPNRPAICVLTFNVLVSLRSELLDRTIKSLEEAFRGCSLHLLDNGSFDGTADHVLHEVSDSWETCITTAEITSPGAGRNRLADLVPIDERVPWVVMSDDDMVWKVESDIVLEHFWASAPDDVVLASCLVEPEYPWSTVHEAIDCGGVKALVRDSVPAAAWSFRGRDWSKIGPLKTIKNEGEDFEACKRLTESGYKVVAIDLAEHIGDGYSQLGNDKARSMVGRPVDLKKWGLT